MSVLPVSFLPVWHSRKTRRHRSEPPWRPPRPRRAAPGQRRPSTTCGRCGPPAGPACGLGPCSPRRHRGRLGTPWQSGRSAENRWGKRSLQMLEPDHLNACPSCPDISSLREMPSDLSAGSLRFQQGMLKRRSRGLEKRCTEKKQILRGIFHQNSGPGLTDGYT